MESLLFIGQFIAWYIFGYLGMAINFTVRWIRELRSGNKCYRLADWAAELRSKEMVIGATAASYTVVYAILQWIGFQGWEPRITAPFWKIIITQGIFAPSPFTALVAPLSLGIFEWAVDRAKQKISEKAGGVRFDDVVNRTEPVTPDDDGTRSNTRKIDTPKP
jgi:hypothetical protein